MQQPFAPPGGWRHPGRMRLAPLALHEARWPTRLLIRLVNRIGRLEASNLFMLLARDLRLFWNWLMFARLLMPHGRIDRRDTELVILRVAWNCRSRYEWRQHVDIGMRAGLTAEDIMRIAKGAGEPGWTPRQVALLRACDDIHRDRMIGEDTWRQLARDYDQKRLLEVVMLIGHYEMLASVLNSTGLPLDTHLEGMLESSRSSAVRDVFRRDRR